MSEPKQVTILREDFAKLKVLQVRCDRLADIIITLKDLIDAGMQCAECRSSQTIFQTTHLADIYQGAIDEAAKLGVYKKNAAQRTVEANL